MQVKADDTTITFKAKGRISIVWFGGAYGSEANGVLTYKDGYATLKFKTDVASTGGIYVTSITIDYTDIPEDTPVV